MSTDLARTGPRTSAPARVTGPLLDRVPTPRVGDPTSPTPPARPTVWRGRAATAAVAVLALASTGVLAVQNAQAVSSQRAAAGRVASSAAATQTDAAVAAGAPDAVAVGTQQAARAALVASANAAVQDAAAVSAASPHAGDALGALTSASTAVQQTAATTSYSPAALRGQLASLSGARGTVVAAEQAWQVAEQARIAAEQAAAAQAAAAAAAASHPTVARRSTSRATSSGSTDTSAAATGSSTGSVHAVTLACLSTPPGAGSPASASAVGAAINSYRASIGLPELSVSTSGTLSSHALDMAASGGIWHSGFDNIVGCAPSATSLVGAWSRSPSHQAQMARTDVSSMSVGAATADGFLFSAVKFN